MGSEVGDGISELALDNIAGLDEIVKTLSQSLDSSGVAICLYTDVQLGLGRMWDGVAAELDIGAGLVLVSL